MNINADAVLVLLEKQIVNLQRDILVLKEHVEHEPPKVRAGYLLAHQLKGSAACVGFEKLGGIAAEVHEGFEQAYETHQETLGDDLIQQVDTMAEESKLLAVEQSTLYQKVSSGA